MSVYRTIGPLVYFCLTDFFSQQVRVGGRNKNKNKIYSDHFLIELKSKETQTIGLVNAHLIYWPSKAQNIQNLEDIW